MLTRRRLPLLRNRPEVTSAPYYFDLSVRITTGAWFLHKSGKDSQQEDFASDSNAGFPILSTNHQIGNLFDDIAKESNGKHVPAIFMANRLAAKVKSGQLDPNTARETLENLLVSISDEDFRRIGSLEIAKAIRAWSSAPLTDQNVDYFDKVLKEASTQMRIEAFSAMDISEILHSCAMITRTPPASGIPPAIGVSIREATERLILEFINRSRYITVKIGPVGRQDKQWLSIQGLSNIFFAARELKMWDPTCVAVYRIGEISIILQTLVLNHCDKQAINSCQVFHCFSVIKGIIESASAPTEDEVQCVTRFLNQIVRRKETVRKPDLRQTLFDLDARWKNMDSRTRSIPNLVALKFHM
jgi:hypothetical protein